MLELSRAQSSIVMQLRWGHMSLNTYLHRISKLDLPTCVHCWASDETIHHYLFNCKIWKHERWLMGCSLGRASRLLWSLLNTKWGFKELLKYIGRPKRLKGHIW